MRSAWLSRRPQLAACWKIKAAAPETSAAEGLVPLVGIVVAEFERGPNTP